jgi:NitT/TauT family transport system permease protein/sulfonate transport system permease protein
MWLRERVLAEGLVVLAVVGWWLFARQLPDFILPGPLAVAERVIDFFIVAGMVDDTVISTVRVAASVVIAVTLGGILAFIPRRWPLAAAIVHERVKPFLNSFPSIGWAILASIWFGPSNFSVIFVQVAILTPFCLVNISEGLKELDLEVLEMGRSFSRDPVKVFWRITVPLLMPYVVAALRIAYGVGWKIALVSELFGAESGIGFLMLRALTSADAVTLFAACFTIVLIFIAGEKLVIEPLSRRFQLR